MSRPETEDRFDDDDYPAYTMGRAAEMIGATPAFLRALGEARLIEPLRSAGGHRRYSRYQLRIIILEDQLEEAQRINEELRASEGGARTDERPDPGNA